MEIFRFDGTSCEVTTEELDKAVKEIAERHGLVVQCGPHNRGNYDDIKFSKRITFRVPREKFTSGSRNEEPDEELYFRQHASNCGLKPEWFGSEVNIQGTIYRIAGLNAKYRKIIVSVVRSDGKVFKCLPKLVIEAMESRKKAA